MDARLRNFGADEETVAAVVDEERRVLEEQVPVRVPPRLAAGRELEIVKQPFLLNGAPAIIGVSTDVTEVREAQRERAKMERTLCSKRNVSMAWV